MRYLRNRNVAGQSLGSLRTHDPGRNDLETNRFDVNLVHIRRGFSAFSIVPSRKYVLRLVDICGIARVA